MLPAAKTGCFCAKNLKQIRENENMQFFGFFVGFFLYLNIFAMQFKQNYILINFYAFIVLEVLTFLRIFCSKILLSFLFFLFLIFSAHLQSRWHHCAACARALLGHHLFAVLNFCTVICLISIPHTYTYIWPRPACDTTLTDTPIPAVMVPCARLPACRSPLWRLAVAHEQFMCLQTVQFNFSAPGAKLLLNY